MRTPATNDYVSAVGLPLLFRCGTVAAFTALSACTAPGQGNASGSDAGVAAADEAALLAGMARIDSAAASIDSIFQPLPLLTPADEAALRQFSNAEHLVRARTLGAGRALSAQELAALEREGRLVRLANTRHWIIRDLDHSQPLAVPVVPAVLTEMGERFHARLAALGAPAFRLEVTSVLRTAADQEALRQVNPNATLDESTHEHATTFDVLYSAYSAPAEPFVGISNPDAQWVESYLRRYADVSAERVAGRRALELKAILGNVLAGMQREGKVMVTIERLQPVYHITIARAP
ncbi:MAG TPA: DUF5715 family protein [Gemmatimonadaceae bacterium]|nr:DUF5715 family protein [Gemmatimonadaceae bacterium]